MNQHLNALGQPVLAAHAQIPADIQKAADYERHAAAHIAAMAWRRHIQGGSDKSLTLAHNRQVLDSLRLSVLSGAHHNLLRM